MEVYIWRQSLTFTVHTLNLEPLPLEDIEEFTYRMAASSGRPLPCGRVVYNGVVYENNGILRAENNVPVLLSQTLVAQR